MAVNSDIYLMKDPVGDIISKAKTKDGFGTATYSSNYRYRYRLSRVWDQEKPRVNFIMLNPSTANAMVLDPTVNRCLGYAKSWGMGSFEVTNIFALRSTDPKRLQVSKNPVGDRNDLAIKLAAQVADLIVIAWGSHGKLCNREEEVLNNLKGYTLHYLKQNKGGVPTHPLYLPKNLKPKVYS